MFSFIVMLLPLNSTDLQNGGTIENHVFLQHYRKYFSLTYIKFNFCHSRINFKPNSSLAGCVNSNKCLKIIEALISLHSKT